METLREEAQNLVQTLSDSDLKELLNSFEDRVPHFEINASILTIKRRERAKDDRCDLEVWEYSQSTRKFESVTTFMYPESLKNVVVIPGRRRTTFYAYAGKKKSIIKFTEKAEGTVKQLTPETRHSTVDATDFPEKSGEDFNSEVFAEKVENVMLMFAFPDGSLFAMNEFHFPGKTTNSLIKFSPDGKMTGKKFDTRIEDIFPLRVAVPLGTTSRFPINGVDQDFILVGAGEDMLVLRAGDLSEFDRFKQIVGADTFAFSHPNKFVTNEAAEDEKSALIWSYEIPEEEGGSRYRRIAIVDNVMGTMGPDLVYESAELEDKLTFFAPSTEKAETGEIRYKETGVIRLEEEAEGQFALAENLFYVSGQIWKRGNHGFKKLQDLDSEIRGIYKLPPSSKAKEEATDLLDSLKLPVPKVVLGIVVEFVVVNT